MESLFEFCLHVYRTIFANDIYQFLLMPFFFFCLLSLIVKMVKS